MELSTRREASRRYYLTHKEEIKERAKAWELANPERVKARKKAYYEANFERVAARAKAWSAANPEKVKEAYATWKAANPGRSTELSAEWRLANLEQARQSSRDSYRRHTKKALERQRVRRVANPGLCVAYTNKRRALKLSAGGSFTPEEFAALVKMYGGVCLSCGKPEEFAPLTADHVVPLSKGGNNSIDNIQPLCQSCNSSKSVQTVDYR